MKIKVLPYLFFILFLSCDKGYFVSEDVILASAYNEVLLKSEVDQKFTLTQDQDSNYFYDSYINDWMLKKAINHKSKNLPYENKVAVLVDDYKTEMNHYFYNTYYVNNYLDTVIKQKEYDSLYQQLKSVLFVVKEPIIKGLIIKTLKKDFLVNEKIKSSYVLNDSTNVFDLETNTKFDVEYYYFDTINYIKINDISNDINFNSLNFRVQKNNFRLADEKYFYYFNKITYINKGFYPVQIVQEQLKEIILKDRKEILVAKAKQKLLEEELSKRNLKSSSEEYKRL